MSTIQSALEEVENLDSNDQEIFYEILAKRRIEERREEIYHNAESTFEAIKNGTAKKGSIEDLLADLED